MAPYYKIANEYNISVLTLVKFLKSKGFEINNDPMAKISYEIFELLENQFKRKKVAKQSAKKAAPQTKPRTNYIIFEGEKIIIDKPETFEIIGTSDEIDDKPKSTVEIKKYEGERLSKTAKKFNINIKTIVKFLESKGIKLKNNPMARIPYEAYQLLEKEFIENVNGKEEEKQVTILKTKQKNDVFFISFNDLKFQNGRVVFKKWLWQFSEVVEIFVSNPHIREEFDTVKNFFEKALNIKDVKVELPVHISGLSAGSIEAYSTDIAKIDSNLIDAVRVNYIKNFTTKKTVSSNSYIIGSKNALPKDSNGVFNIFYKEDIELLNDILTVQNTKHRGHLEYLAYKQSKAEKLRFLFKPFSFIFLLEGGNQFYIIWETLDTSEATYIWPVGKQPDTLLFEFNKIESVILSIKQGGKMSYVGSTNDLFRRLYHDYSEVNNGFPKWRLELEAITK